MPSITINSEPKSFASPLTVGELLRTLGHDPKRLAVEVNEIVVRRDEQDSRALNDGDRVEIVTLVGGGEAAEPPSEKSLRIGTFNFRI